MAQGEAIVTNEERAAAIRAEAADKREIVAALAHDRVSPAMNASNGAGLHETFERATPSVQPAAEQQALAPEADISPALNQQPSAPEANASPAGTAQRSQASTTASPSPAANADDFDDDVSAVHEKAQNIDRQTFFKQQAVEPGESPNKTGAMELSAFAARQDDRAEKRKKEEEAKRFKDLLKLLDDYIGWLDGQIDHWREQHQAWTEHADAFADARARLERGETNEVGPDGYPVDPKLRAAVLAYEQKFGVRLDVNNMDDVEAGHAGSTAQRDHASRQVRQLERDRQRAQELKEDMERNSNDPATRQRLEEELQHAQGQMRAAEASARSDNAAVKEMVHAEAASTEQDQELAAQAPTAGNFFSGTDDAFEDDGFGGGTSFAKTTDPDQEAMLELTPTFQVAAIGEAAPALDNPEQRPDAAPLNIPSRFA